MAMVAARKRGRVEAAEAGGDCSSGSLCCGECRPLKEKLQRAERRIVLLSELAALDGSADEMLARLSDPKHVHCPLKRGLFQIVREKRNAALAAQSTEENANELAMQAARYFIEMHTDRC